MASWMGRSCTGRRPVQSLLLMSAAATLVTACGGVLRPEFPEVPGVREIDLLFRPRVGMRLTCDASNTMTVSKGTPPWNRQSTEMSGKVALSIPAVGPDYVDLAVDLAPTVTGVTANGVLRFSTKDWSLLRLSVDDGTGKKEIRLDEERVVGLEMDKAKMQKLTAAFQPLQDLLKQTNKFLGRWRVGELRPLDFADAFRVAMPEAEDVAFVFNTTLRRVVLIHGRAVAEFEYVGTGRVALPNANVLIDATGVQWVDLLTGLSLRSVQKVTGRGESQNQKTTVELTQEQLLDCTESKL